MNSDVPYQVGQVVGAILGVGIIVGVFVLFIIALIRSIKTRKKGWIITTILSGLPVAAFTILFLIGMAIGIVKGVDHDGAVLAPKTQTAADLLGASMTPVSGSVIPYEISFPWLSSWHQGERNGSDFDQLYNFHDAYLGVIAETIGVGTPQRAADLSQKNLVANASQYTFTTPQPLQIDSHSWLTYDAAATVSGVNFKYRYYVYADSNYTFQIVSWTGAGGFDTVSPVFDRVAKSFKMPK